MSLTLTKPSRKQGWLLTLGVVLFAGLLAAHGTQAVLEIAARARFRALIVIAAHVPQTFLAALGWRALLPREHRPGLGFLFRLRLIKEAVNALLPVAQVGGDVVRARLAVSPRRSLAEATASCILDVLIGTAALVAFVLAGLLFAAMALDDPRVTRIGFDLLAGAALLGGLVVLGERLGFFGVVERVIARWRTLFGGLADLGTAMKKLAARRRSLVQASAWHLASWGFGTLETFTAMWAIGLEPTLQQAFILESLAQAIKGLGFAVPGALGVQEGGYILLCGSLGIAPDLALALSLLRRLRELVLGSMGLIAWRTTRIPPERSVA